MLSHTHTHTITLHTSDRQSQTHTCTGGTHTRPQGGFGMVSPLQGHFPFMGYLQASGNNAEHCFPTETIKHTPGPLGHFQDFYLHASNLTTHRFLNVWCTVWESTASYSLRQVHPPHWMRLFSNARIENATPVGQSKAASLGVKRLSGPIHTGCLSRFAPKFT